MMRKVWLFIALICALSLSCKKEKEEIIPTVVPLGIDAQVRAITQIDSLWFVGGGEKDGPGFLAFSSDLASFELREEVWPMPVYSAAIFRGQYFFGTDEAELFTSHDLMEFATHWPKEEYFINSHKKQPLHELVNVREEVFGVGGGVLQHGLILRPVESENQFSPLEYDNELRGLAFASPQKGWAVGNGLVLHSQDSGNTWIVHDVDRQYYTDIWFRNASHGFMSTFQGAIYETENGGSSWKKTHSGNQGIGTTNFLRKVAGDHLGNCIAVGDNGSVLLKLVQGEWEPIDIGTSDDLFAVASHGNGRFVIGGKGRLYFIEL